VGDFDGARFFPDDHDIKHAADQPVSFGEQGLQLTLTPSGLPDLPEQISGIIKTGDTAVRIEATAGDVLPGTSGRQTAPAVNLFALILLAMLGGVILNLMPCVLPVLSIKALGFVHTAAEGQASDVRRHGLWYTAGVLTCFAGLAMAVIAVRSATGIATWGFWLQDPLVVTALILLLFVIGLWLLGWLEFGTSLQSVGDSLAQKQGSAGAFFTGALAAVVGAPCTGPFLGAALGAVLSMSDVSIFIVLLAMGFGMALPILLLSMIPGLQSRLPKPGAWMETLKQVFAFPMFLTAAWLLSVLGALSGYRSAAIIVAGAALIAFGFWAFRAGRENGKAVLLSILGLASVIPVFVLMSASSAPEFISGGLWLAGLIGAFVVIARLSETPARGLAQVLAGAALVAGFAWPIVQSSNDVPATATQTAYQVGYETEAWSPERVAELQAEGRSIFVDFTAEWCATCQANKLQTLQTRAVSEAFAAANVAFLVADYTRPDAVIAAALKEHNRAGVPMYLWYEAGTEAPEVLPEILSVSLVTGLTKAN
ncbi:MAG: thioredoxin family protein, partial [Pseudomonadota bacterium]